MDHIKKGKRTEGKAKLAVAAQKLERRYTDTSSYKCTPSTACNDQYDLAPLFGLPKGTRVYSGDNNDPAQSAYYLELVAGATTNLDTSFVVWAVQNNPTSGGVGNFTDTVCADLNLNSAGTKDIGIRVSGPPTPTGTRATCW
jgi:Tfp pilus assembly protein PilE